MRTLLGGLQLLLAAVLGVAGGAKLWDRPAGREALIAFGVPRRVTGPMATLLPLVELALAVAILHPSSVFWAAGAAAGLLLTFGLALALRLRRGHTEPCRCFGRLQTASASPATVMRAFVLAALAIVLAIGSRSEPSSPLARLAALDAAQSAALAGGTLLVTFVLALGWLSIHLLHQQGRLLVRIESLERRARHGLEESTSSRGTDADAPAPGFDGDAVNGGERILESLGVTDRPALLVFADRGCGPCNDLLPDLARWQDAYDDVVTVALLHTGRPGEDWAQLSTHAVKHVVAVGHTDLFGRYGCDRTPSAVLVDRHRRMASPVVAGTSDIRALLDLAVHGSLSSEGEPQRLHEAPPNGPAATFGRANGPPGSGRAG